MERSNEPVTWTADDPPATSHVDSPPSDVESDVLETRVGDIPTVSLVEREPWPSRTGSRVLIVLNIFLAAAYLGWWSVEGHVGHPVLFGLLAAVELFTLVNLIGLWHGLWNLSVDRPPPRRTEFSVDVFIPTYGEPLETLRRTVGAACDMDGAHTVWVLDDAVRSEVRAMAEGFGARYLPREDSTGAKAGNLNHALSQTHGDLIVVFDADHVPRRDFLVRLLGYFEDPSVGLVQSPQVYGNAPYDEVARLAWLQQTVFYGPVLRGKHGVGSAFMCGTNAIVRREAVEQVGGFREDSIVEDMATSLRLNRERWRVVYFPFALAEGEGPQSLAAYLKQQFRWARGALGLLFGGEPLRRGHPIGQRLQHLLSSSYYLIGLVVAVYLTLPVVSLLGRVGPFGPGAVTFPLFWAPYIATSMLLMRRELRGRFGRGNLAFTFGAFPTYVAALVSALTRRDVSFSVTGTERGTPPPPAFAWVTVAAWVITAGALVVAPLLRPLDGWYAVSVFWALVNLVLLWPTVKLTVREWGAARRGEVRSRVEQPAEHGAPRERRSTWLLGGFTDPPLPEEVLPEFEQRRS